MPGIGSSNVGVAPFGPGAPAIAAEPTPPPQGAKFINYRTGDYERDETGAYRRMPVTRQRVQLAVMTRFRSAGADLDLGTKFPEKIGDNFERRVQQEIRRALSRLIAEGEIVLNGVSVVDDGTLGRRAIVIDYTPAEGTPDQLRI